MSLLRLLGKLATAVWLGLNTLRRVLHLILLMMVFSIIAAVFVDEPRPIPESAALLLDPSGTLVEQLTGTSFDRALAELDGSLVRETLLRDVVESIDLAREDDRIKVLVLNLDGLGGGGLAKLQSVREALMRFRATGKQIIAVNGSYDRDQYYLASAASEVIMDDLGIVYLEGYEYFRTYMRGALEKLSIDLNVFRVGEYKSFVEPFIRDDMSAEDKEASARWLNSLWGTWTRDVLAARDIDAAVLADYINRFPDRIEDARGHAAQAALDAGLVDRLMDRPAIDEYLTTLVGESENGDRPFSAVGFGDYVRTMRKMRMPTGAKKGNVAVVVASGMIVDGEAAPGTVGGDSMAAVLREVRLDDAIDAVVLRIDSPGGSMYASEVIFDEVVALKAAGKPVVASMSAVAASGGYYIAMPADEIWAAESTITGSIGVGALVPTVQRGLGRLGLNVDGIGTTPMAGQARLDRELGDGVRRVIKASIEDAYAIFVGKVAASRQMSVERADGLARGRVWVGSDALDLGLVDHLGGLEQAVSAAATRAGLDDGEYDVRYLDGEQSLRQRLLQRLASAAVGGLYQTGLGSAVGGSGDGLLRATVRALDREWTNLARLNDPRGLYLHCLCMTD